MHEDVPFGMKLWRLLHAFHGFDLRENFMEEASLIEQQKSLARLALSQHFCKLIAHTLARHLVDLRRQLLDGRKCLRLDLVAEARRKTHSAQHAQVIFGK